MKADQRPWAAAAKATSFAEREFQVCIAARLLENERTCWVAAGGGPMYSLLMAKRMYYPDLIYVTEDGIVSAEPLLPFDPMTTLVGARPSYRALMWASMNAIGDHTSVGYMDYGILNSLQLDPYGNINSTWLGTYDTQGRRVGGPGGADSIEALCWRTIIMADHQRRKFVPKVDFISSAGYLDGSPGARERAGLPPGTGPWRVVTTWALFDFEPESHYLRLIAIAPFVTLEQVLGEMSFRPLIAEELEVLDPPTEEELLILRTEMDVRGQFMDISQYWVEREGDGWHMRELKKADSGFRFGYF